MAFIDHRINDRYKLGFSGGPEWNTRRTPMDNGRVLKNRQWLYPLGKWTTDYSLLSAVEQETLRAAFWVCAGGFADFRFRDWSDFKAVHQLIGMGDGTATPLQLVRNYVFGPASFVRPINLPLNVVVTDEDDAIVPVTVNPLTGMVTPVGTWPTGKALYWDGEFDVRACFDQDYNPLTWESSRHATCQVTIIESRG